MASQAMVALNKLVYKYYNDGDVYDNRYRLKGWANDISSYANWLYEYIPETAKILNNVRRVQDESGYEDLLKDLTEVICDDQLLADLAVEPKTGSVYNCNGPFEFIEDNEYDGDEDDYDYEDEQNYDDNY